VGVISCGALIIQKLVEDTVIFAYAGGLLAFGLVLWFIARAASGPAEEVDPEQLAG
jgi:type IV secretory pathway TrbD component